jgi:ubiquinone/menaquinone biosynthesis C-methylase UbiE
MMKKAEVELEFSEKYTREHAERYLHKHRTGVLRRLSTWREVQIARQALKLAGQPQQVLDLPCGAGRFWPMLAEQPERCIIGADNSAHMVAVACHGQPRDVVARVTPLQTSAFAIDLPDNAVDSVFSMRLLHHIGQPQDRLRMLREFHRVTRDSVIVSLWVDGNYKAWKKARGRKRLDIAADGSHYQNRFVIPTKTIEAEFRDAGFRVQEHLDFIPLYAMWRIYILRKA